MAFAVLLHPKAARTLQKTEGPTRSRIKEKLRERGDRPERAGKLLKHSDFWSLRVGDYRAIYEIDKNKNRVVVLFIGHRSQVYDDFSRMFRMMTR